MLICFSSQRKHTAGSISWTVGLGGLQDLVAWPWSLDLFPSHRELRYSALPSVTGTRSEDGAFTGEGPGCLSLPRPALSRGAFFSPPTPQDFFSVLASASGPQSVELGPRQGLWVLQVAQRGDCHCANQTVCFSRGIIPGLFSA